MLIENSESYPLNVTYIIIHIHYTNRKLIGPLDISPPERMKSVSEQLKTKTLHREVSPCGNFSAQYRCMCELHGLPYLDEVAWVCFYSCIVGLSLCLFFVNIVSLNLIAIFKLRSLYIVWILG